VLGSRIETQRQALREALTAADGVVQAGLVPDQPAGPDRSHPSFSASGRFAASPSEPPSSISSKSSTPHPQSLEMRPQRRSSSVMPALVALLGISAAAGALFYVNNQGPPALPNSGANIPDKAAAAKKDPLAYTPEPGPWGLNVDSIPAEEAAQPGRPGRPGRPHNAPHDKAGDKATEKDKAADIANPYRKDVPKDDGKGEKPPEAEAEPTPPEPAVEPPPAEKAPPPDQRAPLNRAAALTALSAAATSAASCKRPGGPTGTGTVSVTFSPEGPVASVNVSAPFGGTPVCNCVQTVFRNARVAPFSGSSVTLSKSFRIAD
jgi:hypothetical protein